MTSFKPQDSKREEFRKYLERSGVMEAFAKIFAALYEEQEKPSDAIGYVYKALGDDRPCRMEYSNEETLDYAAKIQSLEAELAEARVKIQQLEQQASKVDNVNMDSAAPSSPAPIPDTPAPVVPAPAEVPVPNADAVTASPAAIEPDSTPEPTYVPQPEETPAATVPVPTDLAN